MKKQLQMSKSIDAEVKSMQNLKLNTFSMTQTVKYAGLNKNVPKETFTEDIKLQFTKKTEQNQTHNLSARNVQRKSK